MSESPYTILTRLSQARAQAIEGHDLARAAQFTAAFDRLNSAGGRASMLFREYEEAKAAFERSHVGDTDGRVVGGLNVAVVEPEYLRSLNDLVNAAKWAEDLLEPETH